MNDSHSPSDPSAPRPTLKLKAGARRQAAPAKVAPAPTSKPSAKLKPGAHWADEYKERMQAEMDALLR